ncbi:MAG: hypothetical protein DRG40_00395 [Deltaproteobacteria bacterium]|nr:MAG: hypothetical protein DRG40_00395 [Deltaproteobacteria bacterium]
MKITVIGSTQYRDKIKSYVRELAQRGNVVRVPAFDDHPEWDELRICEYNRRLIEWAEEVHIFWDQRSMGTVFDFGMAFALRKPVKVVYLEPKTFAGVMKKYEALLAAEEREETK